MSQIRFRPVFKCPYCGAESYNANDIREQYCGRCHAFVDPRTEQLLSDVLATYPLLDRATAIDMLRYFGGI